MSNTYLKCQCKNRNGETSVMCCNDCGLPTEDFWTIAQPEQNRGQEEKSVNFMQTVPDSHSWASIGMLLNFLEHYKNGDVSANYLIIGLQNTRNNGYELTTPSTPQGEVEQAAKEYVQKHGGKIAEVNGYPVFAFAELQDAFLAGASWQSLSSESSVEFAEWIRLEQWDSTPQEFGKWYKKNGTTLTRNTTEQLYQLFLTRKQSKP